MSLGSPSPEHTHFSVAMNQLGGRSIPAKAARPIPIDSSCSGQQNQESRLRPFGVTADYLVHAEELEIKMHKDPSPAKAANPAKKSAIHSRIAMPLRPRR